MSSLYQRTFSLQSPFTLPNGGELLIHTVKLCLCVITSRPRSHAANWRHDSINLSIILGLFALCVCQSYPLRPNPDSTHAILGGGDVVATQWAYHVGQGGHTSKSPFRIAKDVHRNPSRPALSRSPSLDEATAGVFACRRVFLKSYLSTYNRASLIAINFVITFWALPCSCRIHYPPELSLTFLTYGFIEQSAVQR